MLPTVGALVGVFLGDGAPPSVPPPDLNFTTDGGTAFLDFTTLSPQLGQVFLIGDGRTTTGQLQSFLVPPGATRLYFGIADGFQFQGPPGCYFDNSGGGTFEFAVYQSNSSTTCG